MENDFDIYVINLDKDTNRLEKINNNLDNYIRIPGIYGQQEDFIKNNDIFYLSRYVCPKSTIGCCMSHRLATKTFLETSTKEYALILEDDAEPCFENYMEKINESIQNAPSDWDIIKLDYLPKYNIFDKTTYTKIPSLLLTAYIINKKSAEKILKNKIIYYPDIQINFMGLNIYNNPEIIFEQTWDEENHSNNRIQSVYNIFGYESWNFKAIRIFEKEYTFGDLFLFILILIFILLLKINNGFFINSNKIEKIELQ
uniref:Glycosyl transferase family 25 domain-containing protein n=1 Tax=viral metagenome TaxID=1070528 RepID=A0A6C0DDK0_9ZZZZ